MSALPFLIVIPFLLTALSLEAQFQDRLYPFRELTDEMRARIDLKDGSIEDWLEILGEPTLTGLDFASSSYDPSSYDCRLWLAWHDATDHLFVAVEIVDDSFVDMEELYGFPLSFPSGDSSVWFLVDGDKSGGTLVEGEGLSMHHAQWYTAFARTYTNDSNVILVNVSQIADWVHQLPYADGGGGIVDSQPITSVIEFFVTPFDRLIWDDPEKSEISDLHDGTTIRFALSMQDYDSEEGSDPFSPSWLELFGPDASYGQNYVFEVDLWAHGILLGADGGSDGSAVESVAWGRIKASLSE